MILRQARNEFQQRREASKHKRAQDRARACNTVAARVSPESKRIGAFAGD